MRIESREAGFSLVEVMVYTVLVALIGVPIVGALMTGSRFARESDAIAKIQVANRSALYRIDEDFSDAVASSVKATSTEVVFLEVSSLLIETVSVENIVI